MKVALCLSGHLRTFDLTYQSYVDQILSKYDCDVFISTWKNLGNAFAYHCAYTKGADQGDPIVEESKVREMFNPMCMHMDDAETEPNTAQLKKDFNEIRTQNGAHMAQIMCMLYKIWDCNRLKIAHEKVNNFKYDVVIRSRFDVFFNKVNLELVQDKIHFIRGHMGVADFVFIGPSQQMDDVCDIYTVMSPDLPYQQFVNIEHMWYAHLANNSIPFGITSGEVFDYNRYANSGVFDMFGNKLRDY